jgi:16S rRNA (adenine1518-N6/adenine1519-N6)-dimethyltransferase
LGKHANLKLNKALGQHFLTDITVLKAIADRVLSVSEGVALVEIGPGAGALSALLKAKDQYLLIEYDERWASYLQNQFPELKGKVVNKDVLEVDFGKLYDTPFVVAGNFPYNISSQIMFKILDNKDKVPAMVGMFQKEVAERICSKEGSKAYGILSVLIQAYYDTEYLFDVPASAFNPPPKVVSGVMEMRRKSNIVLPCNENLFLTLVKTAFNQRRKTMRNSLRSFLNEETMNLEIFDMRPEQLSVNAFINLTNIIEFSR